MDIGIENVSLQKVILSEQENKLQQTIITSNFVQDNTSSFSVPYNQYTTVPFYNKFVSNNGFSIDNSFQFTCNITGFYEVHFVLDSSYEDNFGDRYVKVYKNDRVIYSYQSPLLYRPIDYTINVSFKNVFNAGDVLQVKMNHTCSTEDPYINHDNSLMSLLALI